MLEILCLIGCGMFGWLLPELLSLLGSGKVEVPLGINLMTLIATMLVVSLPLFS